MAIGRALFTRPRRTRERIVKIYAIVVADEHTPETPRLIDAWDAAMVDANRQGWRDNVAEESKGTHAATAVVIEVPDGEVLALVYPDSTPSVQGSVRLDAGPLQRCSEAPD
jgi:hypothetical protein